MFGSVRGVGSGCGVGVGLGVGAGDYGVGLSATEVLPPPPPPPQADSANAIMMAHMIMIGFMALSRGCGSREQPMVIVGYPRPARAVKPGPRRAFRVHSRAALVHAPLRVSARTSCNASRPCATFPC